LGEHLGYEKYSFNGHHRTGNSRNGSYEKRVKAERLGNMEINIPRDCNGEFSPQMVP
jgi:putative transposase